MRWDDPGDWTDIAGHRVHVGLWNGVQVMYLLPPVDVPARGTSVMLTLPEVGDWWVGVSAVNYMGIESPYTSVQILGVGP